LSRFPPTKPTLRSYHRTTATFQKLSLRVSDPITLVNNVASRYLSPARIITEFVDNSIDDMERQFNAEENSYSRCFNVNVHINSKKSYVRIVDNANGMSADTLARLVSNIGDSSKRSEEKAHMNINGRFGFGVQSFRAAANKISIVSCHRDNDGNADRQFTLSFTRDQADDIEAPHELPDEAKREFPGGSIFGTEVTIEHWKSDWLTGSGGVEKLHEQLQRHFERLLHRRNITINVVDDVKEESYACVPLDYSTLISSGDAGGDDEHHSDFVIQQRVYLGGKRHKPTDFIDVLFMIIPKEKVSAMMKSHEKSLPVNIYCNGRRVSSLRYLKSFMSKSKNAWIWNHPQLVGYVEASCLTPVITRDEFKKNAMRNKVYQSLHAIETKLSAKLENHGHSYIDSDETFQKLESVINNALSFVVREEKQENRMKEEYCFGEGERGNALNESYNLDNGVEVTPTLVMTSRDISEGDRGVDEVVANDFGTDVSSVDDSAHPSGRKQPDSSLARGVGLGVKFVKNLEDNRRAQLVGSYIEIDVMHPDFETRVSSKNGHPRLTERLLGYVANVVSAAYLSSVQGQHSSSIGGSNSDLSDGVMNHATRGDTASSEEVYDELLDTIVKSSTRLEDQLQKQLPALQKEIDQMIKNVDDSMEERSSNIS